MFIYLVKCMLSGIIQPCKIVACPPFNLPGDNGLSFVCASIFNAFRLSPINLAFTVILCRLTNATERLY